MKKVDLTGQRFGRLLVLKRDGSYNGSKVYLCRCDCGKQSHKRSDHLRGGLVKSCGCFRKENQGSQNRTHGMSGTKLYNRFMKMLWRCYDPKCPEYRMYGGRGVEVCDRWNPKKGGGFANFLADMGEPPDDSYDLDKEVKGGIGCQLYSPETCSWVTHQENCRNTRSSRMVTYNGKTQCLKAWAEQMEMPYGALQNRIDAGWDLDRAFFQPLRADRRRKEVAA